MRNAIGAILCLFLPAPLGAKPVFVNYPAHPATYGDHTIDATWVGGPVESLTVELQTDESVLHTDGVGQSQRTARNTLNYAPPSEPDNPQNYDDLALVGVYGDRVPLLQQLSANGVSTLSYMFPTAVGSALDLIVTDVDSSDSAVVQAFGLGGDAIDMATWFLAAEGDLSLYKDTGTVFSDTIAPTPTTEFTTAGITLTAESSTNYNRSYTVLRAPPGEAVARIDITFTGIFNSPGREQGGNGSHIYLGLATTPSSAFGDFDENGTTDAADYTLWRDTLGSTDDLRADGDLSGVVDAGDFQLWQANFGALPLLGSSAESKSVVPEPAGWLLMAASTLFCSRTKWTAFCKC